MISEEQFSLFTEAIAYAVEGAIDDIDDTTIDGNALMAALGYIVCQTAFSSDDPRGLFAQFLTRTKGGFEAIIRSRA